jgi:hypothetical protein
MRLANELRGFFETLAEHTQSTIIELQQTMEVTNQGYENRKNAYSELLTKICHYTEDMCAALKIDAEADRKILTEQIEKSQALLGSIRKALLTGELPDRPHDAKALAHAVSGERLAAVPYIANPHAQEDASHEPGDPEPDR